MTSLVFHPRPKSVLIVSVLIVLLTIFSATTLYAGARAQTLSEGLGQGEVVKVRTPINGGVDVNSRNADDTPCAGTICGRDRRRFFCRQGVSNE